MANRLTLEEFLETHIKDELPLFVTVPQGVGLFEKSELDEPKYAYLKKLRVVDWNIESGTVFIDLENSKEDKEVCTNQKELDAMKVIKKYFPEMLDRGIHLVDLLHLASDPESYKVLEEVLKSKDESVH